MEKSDKIIIISSTDSFLTRSFSTKFGENGYKTVVVSPDERGVEALNESALCAILYLDTDVATNVSILTLIKERIVECDLPVFLIGRIEDIAEASLYLNDKNVKDSFMRPVDVGKVVESIVKYIHFFGTENRKVILCVDDSGVELRAIKNMFDSKYNVMLADSAIMAIKSITLKRPDLILLDYSMPIVNGMQVYEMIKAESDFSNIPIMFLTAMDDKETATKLMKLRPEAYILKETPADKIVEMVDNFFIKQKAKKY